MNSDRARATAAVVDDATLARVELLGAFRVVGPHGAGDLGGGLAAALVAVLALRLGRPVDRDDLIAALWPSGSHDDAGPALRQLVARARRVLPDGAIERAETGGRTAYSMSPVHVAVDVVEFERLAHATDRAGVALDLVRGVPFTGLPELDVFDDARRSVERRIGELRRARLVADAEACRSSLLPALDEALAESRDDEALWTAKVRYLARTGRSAAAARSAMLAREALRDVGIEPGPALRQAEQLALDLGSMSPFQPPPLPLSPDLVGRSRERADAVHALLDRGTRLVTLWGAPGMGASSLLASVVSDVAAAGSSVAFVSAPHAAEHVPTDLLLEDLATQLGWTSRDSDPSRWMGVVVPAGSVLAMDAPGAHDRVAAAVRVISQGWPGPVVIAASRPTGLPGEHAVHLSALAHDAAVELLRRRTESLRGRPIGGTELGALDEICERSGGIPLVIELVAHQLATCSTTDLLAGPIASGLTERIDAVVARLSDFEREVLHRIVWIGGPFDLVDAARMFPRPRPPVEDVRRALATLVDAGLVQFDDRPTSAYRMLYPTTSMLRARDAALSVQRSASRRRIVTLAGRGRWWASRLGRPGEPVARSMLLDRLPELSHAARDPSVSGSIRRSLLRASVEVMGTVGRAEDARRLLLQAVQTDADFARHAHDLVVATYAVDDHRGVVELAQRARSVAVPACDRTVIGTIAVRSLRTLGRFDEAHGLLDELASRVSPDHALDRASLQMEQGMVLVHENRRDEAVERLTEARIDFQHLDIVRAVGACDIYLAWCACANGAHDRADELLRRAWDVAIELGHTADDMFSRATSARFAAERGRYEQALQECRVVEAFARSTGDHLILARALEVRSAAERGLGRAGDEAAFEAALIRRRIQAPLSPFERRWTHGERLLTIAGL